MRKISRKKLYVAYFLAMPFIAGLFVYYASDTTGVGGMSALIIGSILLFCLVYWNLRAFLEWKKNAQARG